MLVYRQIENHVLFHRIECQPNASLLLSSECHFRPVAPNVFNMSAGITLRYNVDLMEVHMELYRRYNTYQKYLIDRWENMCDYLSGRNRGSTMVLLAVFNNFPEFVKSLKSCPFKMNDTLVLSLNNYNMGRVRLPLLSAGQYRFACSFTAGKERSELTKYSVYFSISDHRVWQWEYFWWIWAPRKEFWSEAF